MTIHTYLKDLATYLQAQGFGTLGVSDTTTSIQIAGYHEAVGNAIFITPYGGADLNEIVTGEEDAKRPDFQVLIRNQNFETALGVATDIYELLRKKVDWDIGSTHFIYLRGKAPPLFVMKHNSGFYILSINFSAIIQ